MLIILILLILILTITLIFKNKQKIINFFLNLVTNLKNKIKKKKIDIINNNNNKKKKKITNFLQNNTKTIIIVSIFLYIFTFPLYHPDKKKNKDEKAKKQEEYNLKYNKLYKKKRDLNLIKSVFDYNQLNFPNKDDKLFFQFPQRKKKRILKKKELELKKKELETLLLIEKDLNQIKLLNFELEKINLELQILKDKYGI